MLPTLNLIQILCNTFTRTSTIIIKTVILVITYIFTVQTPFKSVNPELSSRLLQVCHSFEKTLECLSKFPAHTVVDKYIEQEKKISRRKCDYVYNIECSLLEYINVVCILHDLHYVHHPKW